MEFRSQTLLNCDTTHCMPAADEDVQSDDDLKEYEDALQRDETSEVPVLCSLPDDCGS